MKSHTMEFPEANNIRMAYIICFSQRSGSNFLCALLKSTGEMGAPDEFFTEGNPDYKNYTSKVELMKKVVSTTTTPNGVFGFKILLNSLPTLNKELDIFNLFPSSKVIVLDRMDKIAQAVSLEKARQSGQWRSIDNKEAEPVYNCVFIRKAIKSLEKEKRNWIKLLDDKGIRPLTITYEALADNPQKVCQKIADFCGIGPIEVDLGKVGFKKQYDATNEAWIYQYREVDRGYLGLMKCIWYYSRHALTHPRETLTYPYVAARELIPLEMRHWVRDKLNVPIGQSLVGTILKRMIMKLHSF